MRSHMVDAMRSVRRLGAGAERLIPMFEEIRSDAEVDLEPGADALREALDSAQEADFPHITDSRSDATDIPFVTIDPVGSRDLDQALHIDRLKHGLRVRYAIADVAAHVVPGGALDRLAHERGVTVYSPDTRIGLHPPQMSEGHASLLAEQRTKAIVWSFVVTPDGELDDVHVERAWVRSRRQYAYRELVRPTGDEERSFVAMLAELGNARRLKVRAQGGVTLPKPSQEIVHQAGHYTLKLESGLPIEDDNAQVSLATGMVGASLMIDGGVGVLRTMPMAAPESLKRLRSSALALGVAWTHEQSYAEVLDSLDLKAPHTAAFLDAATALFRGANWQAFDTTVAGGTLPDPFRHGALGAPYAHVTAPLRRLVDRYAAEAALAQAQRRPVPEWTKAGLERAAADTAAGSRRAADVDRRSIDAVESAVLHDRIGETFEGVGLDDRTIQLTDPPVVARCDGEVTPGVRQRVRLVSAEPPAAPEFTALSN